MTKFRIPIALMLLVLFAAALFAAQEAPAAEDAQPQTAPQPAEGAEMEAPAAAMNPTAVRQAEIYQNYERLVRVMDIVESRYVTPVDAEDLFEGAIGGILGSLDPYSAYFPPDAYKEFMEETEQQFSGIGITIAIDKDRVQVISTVEDMPAFRAGVQPGDYIMKVAGATVEELGSLSEVAGRLRGATGTSVEVTFFRAEPAGEYTVTLVREEIPISTLRGYKSDPSTGKWDFMIDPQAGVGYIRIIKFSQNTADELDDTYNALVAAGLKALIIDLRYNPGGLLDSAVDVADRFFDDGLIVRTQGRAGIHSESYARPYATYKPVLPLVLLVNEYTASAGEVLGGALKDHHRAVLVGTRTFGKGSVQNVIDLDGHGAIKLTVAYYYTPSGRLVHRVPDAKDWGLEPDVVQPMTSEEVTALREQWNKAAAGAEPTLLGEGGGDIIDIQLSRALDIVRGMLMATGSMRPAGN